jgi:hypothetical protein
MTPYLLRPNFSEVTVYKRADEIRPGDRWTDGGGTEWLVKDTSKITLHDRPFIELTLTPTDRELLLMPMWQNKKDRWLPSTKLKIT